MITDRQRLEELLGAMAARRPPVTVVPKSAHPMQRWIDHALRVLTLGGQDRYMTEYVTTLGRVIYVPEGWEESSEGSRWKVLRHELVHVSQFERWGWLG